MYIEDLLSKLDTHCRISNWDSNVVQSLNMQITFHGSGFTEKQSQLALKIIRRYRNQLDTLLGTNITPFLDTPIYRLPIRVPASNYRKISIVPHYQWIKAIKVEFPYNEMFVQSIRDSRNESSFAVWDKDAKAWMFSLSEHNIKTVQSLAEKDLFDVDNEFKEYVTQINIAIANMENFMPMLTVDNGIPKYVNSSHHIPKLTTTNVVGAIFEARKSGIDVWDESIDTVIDSGIMNEIVRSFVRSPATSKFHVDSTNISMNALKDIVQYLEPGLIIIPGGLELSKTTVAYNFLKEHGVKDEEISVMFRLPNNIGKEFNYFVKDHNLNNPISEKTRFVFVSTKMPKPVLTSKTKFNCVISLGLHNMHYTIRDFTKNCPNLIFYCEQRPNKDLEFGNL